MSHIAPAIAAAQQRVLKVLLDECTIRRDPEGTRDDTIDLGSLSYGDPSADAAVVASGVACKVDFELRNEQVGEAGQPVVITEYRVAFAHDQDVREGDHVEMTRCGADPSLLGRHLYVGKVQHGSTVVLKRCRAVMRTEGVAVP